MIFLCLICFSFGQLNLFGRELKDALYSYSPNAIKKVIGTAYGPTVFHKPVNVKKQFLKLLSQLFEEQNENQFNRELTILAQSPGSVIESYKKTFLDPKKNDNYIQKHLTNFVNSWLPFEKYAHLYDVFEVRPKSLVGLNALRTIALKQPSMTQKYINYATDYANEHDDWNWRSEMLQEFELAFYHKSQAVLILNILEDVFRIQKGEELTEIKQRLYPDVPKVVKALQREVSLDSK